MHGYDDVDLELLAAAVRSARPDYPAYVDRVADFARTRAQRNARPSGDTDGS